MTDTRLTHPGTDNSYDATLDECRQLMVGFCDEGLKQLMDNASGALLDFAERAESDAVQGRFFEAISEINRQREEIIRVFRREVNRGFEGMAIGEPIGGESDDADEIDGAELSLVDPEEMEESVASENLILRANASYFPELYSLSQRLGVINKGRKLKDHQIPGGPNHLVMAFRLSLQGLDVETRIKVVIYALFDKFLLKRIKPVYASYNEVLASAGILPNLKHVPLRSDKGREGKQNKDSKETEEGTDSQSPAGEEDAQAAPSSEMVSAAVDADSGDAGGEHQALGAELFDSIIDLMSTRAHRGPEGGRGGAGRGASSPAQSGPQTQALLSAISRLQAKSNPDTVSTAVAEATHLPNVQIDTGFIARVKQALSVERQQVVDAVGSDNLPPMDSDLIDLIGMLFEYMLNDPVLPNIAKALLSHLHTPYLKVALIDRRLLVDSKHPARRLLDEMVEAGSMLVEEGNPKRGMFPTMQKIVDRVLQDFTDNVGLFDELLGFFDSKMKEQQRRTDTMEQRTQEAARGRERLTLAKQRAAHEIQGLVSRYPVPQPVARFLCKTWLDHLVFILLRDKQQDKGNNWKQAVLVAEHLVALFEPQVPAEHVQARAKALPQLYATISEIAKRSGASNSPEVTTLLALLDTPEEWQSLDREKPKVAIPQPPGVSAEESTQPAAVSTGSAKEALTVAEEEMIQRLRKMRFGTWFEFTGPEGSAPRRIKLSWMSPLTSTCMFVDRSGVQAEVKSLKELAKEVLAGRAKIVPRPKHPFIDRALVSIRKMLQSDQGPKTGASDGDA